VAEPTLYLIPVPLGEAPFATILPAENAVIVRGLGHFVAEKAKTARAHLKAFGHPVPMASLAIVELDGGQPDVAIRQALDWLLAGKDVGLMSEAGCPAVADPGNRVVSLAYANGFRVRPLVGPSSLLLAIMASGLNGQRFAFHGYLPAKPEARTTAIRELERRSRADDCLQLFIETPYRNAAMFHSLLADCRDSTRLCIATDMTMASERVHTATVANWRTRPEPSLDRRPTVFLLQAG
jgi:16S rRNA (cytidine1402-2'-O)-methyltransferase